MALRLAYLLLYVDDIVLIASSESLLRWIIASLQQEFAMKELGALHHFLGVTVDPHPGGLLLHQWQYTLDILERAGMIDNKPCFTPVDTHGKLSEAGGTSVTDPTAYRSLDGHFSTSPSPGPTSPMQFNRYAYICMILGSHTSLLSSGSFATSVGLLTSASSFIGGRPPPSSSSTLTPTRSGIRTLIAPPPTTPSS